MDKLTLDDLEVEGRRVLVRVDFNVPLEKSATGTPQVGDTTRIRAALPTIQHLVSEGARVVLMSHLGRPGGSSDPELSLAPISDALESLLNMSVQFSSETVGPEAQSAVEKLADGSVLLLENTRFHKGEKANDPDFAKQLAQLGQFFVNDAFGAAHRAHASTEGVAHIVEQAAMGKLMKKEIEALQKLLEDPDEPFVAILGGAKVSDKIQLIKSLLSSVDTVLVGGAMSYSFMKALGTSVGTSKVEDDHIDTAKTLYDEADGRIVLPSDNVIANDFANDADRDTVSDDIPDGWMGLDIGPDTIETYRKHIAEANTVVWNGPMGVFEMENFANGTKEIANALAEATERGAYTVAGGGDSVSAIQQAGYADQISHVSTGGGAMLTFLEGETLPGIAALTDRSE